MSHLSPISAPSLCSHALTIYYTLSTLSCGRVFNVPPRARCLLHTCIHASNVPPPQAALTAELELEKAKNDQLMQTVSTLHKQVGKLILSTSGTCELGGASPPAMNGGGVRMGGMMAGLTMPPPQSQMHGAQCTPEAVGSQSQMYERLLEGVCAMHVHCMCNCLSMSPLTSDFFRTSQPPCQIGVPVPSYLFLGPLHPLATLHISAGGAGLAASKVPQRRELVIKS